MLGNHEQQSGMQHKLHIRVYTQLWRRFGQSLLGKMQERIQSRSRAFSVVAVLGMVAGVLPVFAAPAHAQVQTIYVSLDQVIERAQQAMMEGHMEVALAHFRKAEQRNLSTENRVIVQNSICAVAFRLGEYAEAETSCSKAINGNRKYWKAFVNRGNVRRASGNMDGAFSDYCEAIRLSPEHVKGNFTKKRCSGKPLL